MADNWITDYYKEFYNELDDEDENEDENEEENEAVLDKSSSIIDSETVDENSDEHLVKCLQKTIIDEHRFGMILLSLSYTQRVLLLKQVSARFSWLFITEKGLEDLVLLEAFESHETAKVAVKKKQNKATYVKVVTKNKKNNWMKRPENLWRIGVIYYGALHYNIERNTGPDSNYIINPIYFEDESISIEQNMGVDLNDTLAPAEFEDDSVDSEQNMGVDSNDALELTASENQFVNIEQITAVYLAYKEMFIQFEPYRSVPWMIENNIWVRQDTAKITSWFMSTEDAKTAPLRLHARPLALDPYVLPDTALEETLREEFSGTQADVEMLYADIQEEEQRLNCLGKRKEYVFEHLIYDAVSAWTDNVYTTHYNEIQYPCDASGVSPYTIPEVFDSNREPLYEEGSYETFLQEMLQDGTESQLSEKFVYIQPFVQPRPTNDQPISALSSRGGFKHLILSRNYYFETLKAYLELLRAEEESEQNYVEKDFFMLLKRGRLTKKARIKMLCGAAFPVSARQLREKIMSHLLTLLWSELIQSFLKQKDIEHHYRKHYIQHFISSEIVYLWLKLQRALWIEHSSSLKKVMLLPSLLLPIGLNDTRQQQLEKSKNIVLKQPQATGGFSSVIMPNAPDAGQRVTLNTFWPTTNSWYCLLSWRGHNRPIGRTHLQQPRHDWPTEMHLAKSKNQTKQTIRSNNNFLSQPPASLYRRVVYRTAVISRADYESWYGLLTPEQQDDTWLVAPTPFCGSPSLITSSKKYSLCAAWANDKTTAKVNTIKLHRQVTAWGYSFIDKTKILPQFNWEPRLSDKAIRRMLSTLLKKVWFALKFTDAMVEWGWPPVDPATLPKVRKSSRPRKHPARPTPKAHLMFWLLIGRKLTRAKDIKEETGAWAASVVPKTYRHRALSPKPLLRHDIYEIRTHLLKGIIDAAHMWKKKRLQEGYSFLQVKVEQPDLLFSVHLYKIIKSMKARKNWLHKHRSYFTTQKKSQQMIPIFARTGCVWRAYKLCNKKPLPNAEIVTKVRHPNSMHYSRNNFCLARISFSVYCWRKTTSLALPSLDVHWPDLLTDRNFVINEKKLNPFIDFRKMLGQATDNMAPYWYLEQWNLGKSMKDLVATTKLKNGNLPYKHKKAFYASIIHLHKNLESKNRDNTILEWAYPRVLPIFSKFDARQLVILSTKYKTLSANEVDAEIAIRRRQQQLKRVQMESELLGYRVISKHLIDQLNYEEKNSEELSVLLPPGIPKVRELKKKVKFKNVTMLVGHKRDLKLPRWYVPVTYINLNIQRTRRHCESLSITARTIEMFTKWITTGWDKKRKGRGFSSAATRRNSPGKRCLFKGVYKITQFPKWLNRGCKLYGLRQRLKRHRLVGYQGRALPGYKIKEAVILLDTVSSWLHELE